MKIEPNRISIQATSFLKAASRCAEQRKIDENTIEWLMVPENVCLAFSIELNIKALVCLEGHTPADVHNFEKLFKQLNGKTQNAIIMESGYDKGLFLKGLAEIANTFEFLRYVYEHQDGSFSINVRMLKCLANLLENKVNHSL